MEKKVSLSAPWYTYYQKLCKLFGQDPEIKIVFDEDKMKIKMFVQDQEKAEAIGKLLPLKMTFGNISVEILIIPANTMKTKRINILQKAFKGNPVLDGIYTISMPIGEQNYVVFKNEVVQFFNDDISDINGNCTTLYQEIAKEIIGNEDVFFCTAAGKEEDE